MSTLCLAVGVAVTLASGLQQEVRAKADLIDLPDQPIKVQFAQIGVGRNVTVIIDGRAKNTFAGKLNFREQNRSWQSVCAEVRKPITAGQIFSLRPVNSQKVGGNVALAGNIVAKYFDSAKTPDQCAALQLAVWEAVEDGGKSPNFQQGRFRAMATPAVLHHAEDFYQAINEAKEAAYLETAQGGGQGQLSSLT